MFGFLKQARIPFRRRLIDQPGGGQCDADFKRYPAIGSSRKLTLSAGVLRWLSHLIMPSMLVALTLQMLTLRSTVAQELGSIGNGKPQAKAIDQDSTAPALKPWCVITDSVLEEAQSLQPAMRAFVLERIADAFRVCRPRAVSPVLEEAFVSTLALSEDQRPVERELQKSILSKLLAVQERKAESLLPEADPEVQRLLASERIARAIQRKDFDGARALIDQVPSDGKYPYDLATKIILGLPSERTADKEALFTQGAASYGESHLRCTECDGFPTMIRTCWRQVPPSDVITAVHEVIDSAETDSGPVESGGSHFASEYDYRLSELLPILKELAPDDVDRILSSSKTNQAQISSDNGAYQGNQPVDPKQSNESNGGSNYPAVQPQIASSVTAAVSGQMKRIIEMAKADPRQAIAAASTLPVVLQYKRPHFDSTGFLAPKAQALLSIARIASKDSPSASLEALEDMAEAIDKGDADAQAEYCREGIGIAERLGAPDLARELLSLGLDQVDRLKTLDTEANDPNDAPKFWWPSTNAATRLLIAASTISPRFALESSAQVDDPELRILLKVRIANHQLGISEGLTTKKNTHKERWTMVREPNP